MTDSELLFFMGATNTENQKVLSCRVSKSDEPRTYPDSSKIYTKNISTCGEGMIQFVSTRPLDTSSDPNGSSVE